jgi:glycolate oxidase FAD binding subunit
MSVAALARALESVVGAPHLVTDGGTRGHAVDGVVPAILAWPGSPEEVADALRICHEARAAVVPRGGGTAMRLGGIPAKVDVLLGLERLNRVLEHEPGDLTSSVQAGMRLSAYQELLGRHGQWLALDPPLPGRATVGGILASNGSGPRRFRYGTARDLLIGARVIHADGTTTKAGAKVVKSVSGYDLHKLHVGSLGSLGVIVEASFRLHPLPRVEETALLAFPDVPAAQAAVQGILEAALSAGALELLDGEAWAEVAPPAGLAPPAPGALLAVSVGSEPEAVAAQLEEVERIGRAAGGEVRERLMEARQEGFWRALRDLGADDDEGVLLKATLPPSRLAEAVLEGSRAALDAGVRVAVVAEAGNGVVRFHLRAGADETARVVGALRVFVTSVRGYLVVAAAPPDVKRAVDVWGPVGDGLPLMRRIKAEFDPRGILSPGRFVAGL